MQEREKAIETHRQAAMTSKRWLTGLIVFSEICFLVASSGLALFVSVKPAVIEFWSVFFGSNEPLKT
jgi:hypothetical protein